MILRRAVYTFLMLLCVLLSVVFFYWAFVFEVLFWEKSLLVAFQSSWWNWLLLLSCLFLTGFFNSLLEEGEGKSKVAKEKPVQSVAVKSESDGSVEY